MIKSSSKNMMFVVCVVSLGCGIQHFARSNTPFNQVEAASQALGDLLSGGGDILSSFGDSRAASDSFVRRPKKISARQRMLSYLHNQLARLIVLYAKARHSVMTRVASLFYRA